MEKATLTSEQTKVLERLLNKQNLNPHEIVEKRVREAVFEDEEVLLEIDVDTLIKALYIGYEVDDSYHVGDWLFVFTDNEMFVAQVVEIRDESTVFDNGEVLRNFGYRRATKIEIMTEKTNRKWKSIGRHVGELRVDDVVWYRRTIDVVNCVYNDSMVRLRSSGMVVQNNELILVCPAEKRFDLHGVDVDE